MQRGFLKSDFLKNAGVLFSSSGIAQAISFFVIPILSRIYLPSEHGVLTLFTSMVMVGAAFTGLRYDQAIVVEEDRQKASNLLVLSIVLNFIWCVLFYGILLFAKIFIVRLLSLEGPSNWLWWVPLTIFAAGSLEALVMWFNREREYKKVATNRVVGIASGTAYKLAHPFIQIVTANGLILGHVFGQLLQTLLLFPKKSIKLFKTNSSELIEIAKRYRAFPIWATPSALVNIIGAYVPVFVITSWLGEEYTGYYGQAIKLTFVPLSAVSYAVGQVYFERLARLKSDVAERIRLSNDLLRFLFLLAVIPVVILMIWGDGLVPWILGPNWEISGSLVQITALFYFVIYLTGPFSSAFEVFNGLKRQLWFTGAFTILTSLSLIIALRFTNDLLIAIAAHAFVGIIIRMMMLFDCMRLVGKNILSSILKGTLIVAGLTLLFLLLKIYLI